MTRARRQAHRRALARFPGIRSLGIFPVSSMSLPRVQILILNWNGFRDTIPCLASVFALDYPDFRVVVCDNGSTDGSIDRIREWAEDGYLLRGTDDASLPRDRAGRQAIPLVEYGRATAEQGGAADVSAPLTVIRNGDNLGFAAGNNVGLRYLLARGDADYVWLLNNDTRVAASALRELVRRAEAEPSCAVMGGTMLELDEPERVQELGGATVSHWHGMVRVCGRGLPASAPRVESPSLDYVSGGCALVRLSALEDVGLLDERFFLYGEDVDWGLRMKEAQYDVCYAPGAQVWHKGGGSSAHGSPHHDYHNVRGALLLIKKHHPARLPAAFAISLVRCLLPKLPRRQWARLAAVAQAYRDVARSLPLVSSVPRTPDAATPAAGYAEPLSGGITR